MAARVLAQLVQPDGGGEQLFTPGDRPADRDARDPVAARALSHLRWGLAGCGLGIEPPLAGDDQVAVDERVVQADLVAHERGSAHQFRAQCGQGEGGAAGCPGTGVPGQARQPRGALEDRGEVPQPGVELFHLAGPGTLLGGKDVGGAVRAVQRATDVNRDLHPATAHLSTRDREVDGGHSSQGAPSRRDRSPVIVEQTRTQGNQDAHPAIGRRAAPDPDDDPSRASVESGAQQLAGTGAVGAHRVAPPAQQAQPGGLRHLHDGHLRPHPAQPRRPARTERAVDAQPFDARPLPCRGEEHVEGAVAAVGNRQAQCRPASVLDPPGQRRSSSGGGEGALERVGSAER